MCGISGIVAPKLGPDEIRAKLGLMWPGIATRGPDGRGEWVEAGVGLLHSRLSIVDLVTGDQPLWNERHTVACLFNGEIYGYQKVREALVQRGHQLATTSDTEVLVHLYEDHSDDLVDHIHGMYAFAIWDAQRRRVLLARDRLGIKPLYVADLDGGGFAYSSSIASLLALGLSDEPNMEAIAEYYRFGKVGEPLTAYRSIRTLLPGHRMTLDLADMRRCTTRFYRLSPRRQVSKGAKSETLAHAVGLARTAFRDAVASHLIADVEVGAFLSGGIDSTLVVAQAQQLSSRPIPTFCVNFGPDMRYSESIFAERVSRSLGTRHETLEVSAPPAELIRQALAAANQPFAIASFLPLLLLCRQAAKQVKVVLTGDGGDEIGYGYNWYGWARWLPRGVTPRVKDSPLSGPLRELEHLTGQARLNRLRRALKFSRGLLAGGASASDVWRYDLTREDSLTLLRKEHRACIGDHPQSSPFETVWNTALLPIEAMREADLTVTLRDEMLPKLDRAGMASGLEGRVPLLDDTFVEAMLAVPAAAHTAIDRRKALLREWATELCPEASIDRPKHGFDVPIADWLTTSLYDDSRRLLLEPSRPGLVDPKAARRLWERMKVGVPGAGHAVYGLLMAELWFEHRA